MKRLPSVLPDMPPDLPPAAAFVLGAEYQREQLAVDIEAGQEAHADLVARGLESLIDDVVGIAPWTDVLTAQEQADRDAAVVEPDFLDVEDEFSDALRIANSHGDRVEDEHDDEPSGFFDNGD